MQEKRTDYQSVDWSSHYKEQLHQEIKGFYDKYSDLAKRKPHLWAVPSKAALYNHALSLLNIEYYKLGKEDREEVLKQYE